MSKQRVTLYLNERLWKMIKIIATGRGESASSFVEGVMYLAVMDTNAAEVLSRMEAVNVAESIAPADVAGASEGPNT